MGNHARRDGSLARAVGAVLSFALALAVGGAAHAGQGEWTLVLEPIQIEPFGHDQHVLTVHEIDFDGTPAVDDKSVVTLDPDSGLAYRASVQHARGQWTWGADLFWFVTSQIGDDRTAAAEGPSGTIDEVVFEVADQSYTSGDPGEILFYDVLEDTDLEMWTFDLYGMRTLAEREQSGVHVQLGLRLGDFDNDYFAVVGIENVGGTHIGASSNYDRMMGPLVGLSGDVRIGKSSIEGYIGQSVLLGTASLGNTSEDFTGSFTTPSFFDREVFQKDQDVAIPITELRIKWTYRISKRVALGAATYASAWWDVPVPPGLMPTEGADQMLAENTIVLFGLAGTVELRF